MKSDYRVVTFNGPRRIIFIEDLNLGRMSITNNAEEVFLDVQSNFQGNPRVVYKDTDGLWWEIKYVNWHATFERFHGVAWDILKDKDLS
jgi:DNA polymerase elongation subunit (family B)